MSRWGRKVVKGKVWHPCGTCGGTGNVLVRTYIRVKGIHRRMMVSQQCGTCKGTKGTWK